jgi:hypothetical protein
MVFKSELGFRSQFKTDKWTSRLKRIGWQNKTTELPSLILFPVQAILFQNMGCRVEQNKTVLLI